MLDFFGALLSVIGATLFIFVAAVAAAAGLVIGAFTGLVGIAWFVNRPGEKK